MLPTSSLQSGLLGHVKVSVIYNYFTPSLLKFTSIRPVRARGIYFPINTLSGIEEENVPFPKVRKKMYLF